MMMLRRRPHFQASLFLLFLCRPLHQGRRSGQQQLQQQLQQQRQCCVHLRSARSATSRSATPVLPRTQTDESKRARRAGRKTSTPSETYNANRLRKQTRLRANAIYARKSTHSLSFSRAGTPSADDASSSTQTLRSTSHSLTPWKRTTTQTRGTPRGMNGTEQRGRHETRGSAQTATGGQSSTKGATTWQRTTTSGPSTADASTTAAAAAATSREKAGRRGTDKQSAPWAARLSLT